MNASRKVGLAHGFLKTGSSPQRIIRAFQNMKADPEVMVPKNIDLIVGFSQIAPIGASIFGSKNSFGIFGVSGANDISQLLRISVKMGIEGANCIVRAVFPDAANKKTALELGQVFNLMYSCTEILGEAEMPVADIYFKNEAGIYVSTLKTNPPM
ncbi:MAG: hypothetical protein ABH983_02705 [Candidatus Micrarchaeota archaeon]|nr:hypothetical protein [Candidatus Micrarchaeota archaeon]MBU1681556.1 hypothetical protein [Candidatus Micrarchaeota archaeon]